MKVDSVVDLINGAVVFMPGWELEAKDYTARHENAVCLTITYKTRDFRRSEAPDYPTDISPQAQFIIDSRKVESVEGLVREVIECCVEVFKHEAREALRVGPNWWGPFNPHTTGGQERWGEVERDRGFGII